jgi:xylulokinase
MANPINSPYILAVDLGSGGPKAALVSGRGEIVARAAGSVATFHTPDGGGEQDANQWWEVTSQCVREVVGQNIVPVEQIAAVSIASQWSVTVPVDEHGTALMNAIHWSDSRGAVHTKRVTDGLIKISGYNARKLYRWIRLTGGMPTDSGNDALAHILFIRHERPEVYARTAKFLEPMDYLNLRLTGRAVASHATVFPYLLTDNRDNTRIDYDQKMIDWCGLDRAKLPDLVPVGTVLGPLLPHAASEWGLAPSTQVVTGTPDSQAAAVGSGAVLDYEAHICMGTTAWLTCHVPFKKTSLFEYLATMPSAIRGRNMVVAEQGPAGKCLGVFVDQWLCPADELSPGGAPDDVYRLVERLAEGVPAGSEGLLFLPWLNGAGPPSGDGRVRGGFLNQSLRTTRAHAVRAVMEGVCFNLRWLQASVERFCGRKFEALNVIGRCATMDVWCQSLADILGCPVRRMAHPEMATTRGAALAALVALGHITVEQIPSLVEVDRTFVPDARNRSTYDRLFSAFLRSYKANRPIFHQLNPPAVK